jgi:hypothetical protein
VKGMEIFRGVEIFPMHARSHWGPKVMSLDERPVSKIHYYGDVRCALPLATAC